MTLLVPQPSAGRVFRARRRVRLSDTDARGRLRLDAVARYLQDVASDDVEDAGWRADEHFWVVRRTRIDVVAQFLGEETVELATWCSGTASSAAARRTSLRGDRGGVIETETIWIHVDGEGRPMRLSERFFEQYAPAAGGRRVSARLELADPPDDAPRRRWPLRSTDVDQFGHVNNAAYWAAAEELLAGDGAAATTVSAVLEYRGPLDPGDPVALVGDAGLAALVVGDDVRARIAIDRR